MALLPTFLQVTALSGAARRTPALSAGTNVVLDIKLRRRPGATNKATATAPDVQEKETNTDEVTVSKADASTDTGAWGFSRE